MGRNEALQATALQTVGVKGWDGFSIAVVASWLAADGRVGCAQPLRAAAARRFAVYSGRGWPGMARSRGPGAASSSRSFRFSIWAW